MSTYKVTALKWRPQQFKDVVGQEHITLTLKNAIKNNRIAHAYIFTGPRGVGKTTTARILAKTLNCLNPKDNEPCNECEMCKSILNNQSLDIIEIDGASNRGIDEIRTLRDSVKYAPTKGKYKVYIIDEVHMLTKESFNAFLKTLEEPPAHTIFIFATTDIHKVPLTIISRCQRFDFRRIQLDEIKNLLSEIAEEEKIKIDDKTLTIIAKKSDGALRDAESYFDQVVSFCGSDIDSETVSKMLNLIDDEIYFAISDAVLNKNFKSVFEVTENIYRNGWSFIDFIDGLVEHFRNIMTVVVTGKSDLVESADIYKSKYLEYKNEFSEGDLLRLLNFLNKAQQELRYSQNHKLKLEIILTHLVGLERSSTISEIFSQLGNGNSKQNSYAVISESKNTKYNSTDSKKENQSSSKRINSTIDEKLKPDDKKKAEELNPNSEFNFEFIVSKWQNFVDEVSNEKRFTLGHFIGGVELQSLNGNKLTAYLNDEEGKKSFNLHKDYMEKKTLEFFGRKLFINFSKSNSTSSKKENEMPSEAAPLEIKKTKKQKVSASEEPIVNAIINELSGKELA